MKASQAEPIEMSFDNFVETYGRLKLPPSQPGALQRTRASIARALSPYRGRASTTSTGSTSKGNGDSSNDHHHSKKSSRDESAFGNGGNDATSGKSDDPFESRGRKADDGTLNVTSLGTRRSRSRKISLGGRLGNAVQSVVLSTKRTSRSNRRSVGPDLALPPLEADEASTSYSEDLKPPMTPTSIGGTTEETSTSSISVEESIGSADIRPKIERSVSRRSDAGDYLPGGTRFANNASAAHRGYLDRKIKRKQWERYWCVLYDSCLYCYNTPLSDVTRHKTMLRGYAVVADVRNLNKSRFTFRLERKDVPSLHFSTGNHQDFLLWVGILEKETSSVQKSLTNGSNSFCPAPSNDYDENYANRRCSDNISDRAPPSPRIRHRNSSPASLIARNMLNQSLEKGQTSPSTSGDPDDSNTVWKQKFALLEEIFDQKNELVKEKMMLEQKSKDPASGGPGGTTAEINNAKVPTMRGSPTSKTTHPTGIQRRVSREAIINQYENAKTKQDVQMAKRLAFLNRRRNSTQLKLDHCIKELAPRGGKKRIDDPMHFSALENRQKELRSALVQLDTELNRGEAHMRCDLVKLQQKRDLELMVLEHTEMCDIIHKHYFNEKTRNEETWLEKYIQRRRLSNDPLPRRPLSATAASIQCKNDPLMSILEKGCSKNCDRVFPQSNCSSASDLSELKSPEFWKRHFSVNGSSQESGSTTGSADGMPSTPEDKMAPSPIQCEMICHSKSKVERRHSSDTGLSSDADSGFQHLDTGGDEGSDESGRRSFGPVPFVTVTDVTVISPEPVIHLESPPSPPTTQVDNNCAVVADVTVIEPDEVSRTVEFGGVGDSAKAQKKISWMEKVDSKTLEIIEDFENFAAKKLMTMSSASPGDSLGSP